MAGRGARALTDGPRMARAQVVGSRRLTPSVQRVTVAGDDLADFPDLGYDQWFRLFFSLPHQRSFDLPDLSGRQRWWTRYLALPEEGRPHCANYTIAAFRSQERELDVDVVLHRDGTGELEGRTAVWACTAQPGDELALLDQGVLFERPDDADEVVVVAEETGLPGVAGILRCLPELVRGRVVQEVPDAADRRDLPHPPGVEVTWVVRERARDVPGAAALAELQRLGAVSPRAYAIVVGESALATGGYRHLRGIGLAKGRITFSGFWKHGGSDGDADDGEG